MPFGEGATETLVFFPLSAWMKMPRFTSAVDR